MENGPFIDDFPIKTSIYKGFSMAMLNNQMVYIYIYLSIYLVGGWPTPLKNMKVSWGYYSQYMEK